MYMCTVYIYYVYINKHTGMYSISQNEYTPSHICKYFIISFM